MSPAKRGEGASGHVLSPFWYNRYHIWETLRVAPDTAKWLPFTQAKAKSLQIYYVSGWSPFMVKVLDVLGSTTEEVGHAS